ncbi:O-antigen ligase [Variovorax boronicumulans]|uniref:PglL family O-oligosaccharyltransferase n=1 Tax=Variovorax boronicumulans TaxID=436515 RepID=UPI0027823371|nr:Wzy polymerase domain-containing protein [Variovorax boronicumulans]MDQ0081493.1 O-antigen ligase [Variovorax boronicumulans]
MSSFAASSKADDTPEQYFSSSICSALIALPFLFPFAAGPSVNAWQQLMSWLCLLALLVSSKAGHFRPCRLSTVLWIASSAGLVAIFRSPNLGLASWLPAVAVFLAIIMAACVGSSLAKDCSRMRDAFAHGLLWAGVVSAVLGLLQYYELASFLWPLTTEPGAGQAFGNLRQRNQFASLISMALIAALWLYPRYRYRSHWRRLPWLGTVVLLLTAAAASTSRTGLLEVLSIIGAATFLAWQERRTSRLDEGRTSIRLPGPLTLLSWTPLYFALAWLLPHLAGSGVDSMVQRLSAGAPLGHSRLILWSNVLTVISERPWTGWGWGELSFAHYMHSGLYPGARFVEILDNAHNLPLHLAVELGVPAAVLICGGFLWLVISARPWRDRDPFRIMAWGLLGVIVLHSLLEYPLWYGPFQLVFGVCLGILWPTADLSDNEVQCWTRNLLAVSVAAFVAIIGYVAWDYIRISQIYLPRNERLLAYQDNTLERVQASWLFANQVRFAKLTLTTATPVNAAEIHALAERTLHFSPEPRVIRKLIESAQLLGLKDEARMEAARFAVAFPLEYKAWLDESSTD